MISVSTTDHNGCPNFEAVLHIVKCIPILEQIPDSFGTKCYVQMISCIIDSFLDKKLHRVNHLSCFVIMIEEMSVDTCKDKKRSNMQEIGDGCYSIG